MNLRVFRLLLRLYPRDHQELFGAEMAGELRQAAEERRREGTAAYLRFAIWELAGLVAGAAAVWAARLAGQPRLERAQETPVSPGNEIGEAERFVQLQIDRMVDAIAHHQFAQARFYSDEERKGRARLRALRDRYGISE